jgi:hypothetical protein
MGIGQVAGWPVEAQRWSHISVAAMLQVGLEEEALHFAAFGLLLGLDLVEGELQGAAGRQPGLEQSELDICRWCVREGGACGCHMLTVLSP